jgi:GNAT superfamily N-acetyltransferase
MTSSEIVQVSELLRESYTLLGELENLSPTQVAFLVSARGSPETIARESQHEKYVIAYDGDNITGVVSVSDGKITKLYVRPSMARRGIGSELYMAAESMIAAAGHRGVSLVAFPSAVPFYEKMGLRVVGQMKATGPLMGLKVTLMEKHFGVT